VPTARQTDEETADPDPIDGPDPGHGDAVLAAERAHLRASREFLQLMRENVLSLKALGGDPVSEEYLKADLYRRAEALKDIPGAPLFFGRLDHPGPPAECFHIGRRHVHDQQGHPMVIDWRAPVSRPFYRASPATPMGLSRRRRFGFSGAELTAYEDEQFAPTGPAGAGPAATAASGGEDAPLTSKILVEEIERPRVGPMRDIVATIQPDQDDIVRAEAGQTVCVQGAPGTGKTAVGLHRVAYLLYAHPERMRRGGVLVVGPNRAFLSYIRGVLPALGELDVSQLTVGELVGKTPAASVVSARAAHTAAASAATHAGAAGEAGQAGEAARIKGDARMAEVLRRALWSHIRVPAEPLVLPRGVRRWRVPGYEISELVQELRGRGVRYGAGRELLAHRIAHVILIRMESAGEPCDDRTHDAVRRTRPVKAAVDATWPAVDPVRLVMRVLSDPGLLALAAGGLLTAAEQDAIRWATPPRGPRSAPWTAADAVLIDEAADLIERTASLNHVVVDEAQDLSPMECRAIGRRCSTGSATVLGDIAQGTTPWASRSWQEFLAHLGKPDADLRVLDKGYRVPRQIIDFASRLLPHIAPGLSPAASVRQSPGSLEVVAAPPAALGARVAEFSRRALGEPGSVGVISADDQVPALVRSLTRAGLPHVVLGGDSGQPDGSAPQDDPAARLAIVPVTLAKGLEFDQVIVVEPARITGAGHTGLRRLYVALTRAVSRLFVLHAEPLPAPLR
jgi:UvrD-like helicase C-terminal domain